MMLPALPESFGNIREVFPAVFSSLKGQPNYFELPVARHAIVIMVDGLGYANLAAHAQDAVYLGKALGSEPELFSVFPSSTVANITSLGTAATPSEHGLFGYKIFDRATGEEHNLLSGMDKYSILDFLNETPVAATNSMNVVTLPAYLDSGFTRATMHGATHYSGETIAERFRVAKRLSEEAPGVTYVYIPELDQAAHSLGWRSETWLGLLQQLNSDLRSLVQTLNPDVGVLLIADHGVVDVPMQNHLMLDDVISSDAILCIGGDPRAAYLYLEDSTDSARIQQNLNAWFDDRGMAISIEQAIEMKLFTLPLAEENDLLPDLVLLPGEQHVVYHRTLSKASSMRMVGQHGGLSFSETALPLLRFGAYSSSDLVP